MIRAQVPGFHYVVVSSFPGQNLLTEWKLIPAMFLNSQQFVLSNKVTVRKERKGQKKGYRAKCTMNYACHRQNSIIPLFIWLTGATAVRFNFRSFVHASWPLARRRSLIFVVQKSTVSPAALHILRWLRCSSRNQLWTCKAPCLLYFTKHLIM